MMNGRELSELVDQRYDALAELLEATQLQQAAIEAGQMTELMRLLSRKQPPLNRLTAVAERIREASADDPHSRYWENEAERRRCRQRQDECEKMHVELLALEAACETQLTESRDAIGKQLAQIDAGREAANCYAHTNDIPTSGGQLDLSSD